MTNPRIPYPTERAQSRGIDKQQWGVLIGTTFANASNGESILQAWDLAKMRGLDVFGGHVAIVSQSRYDRASSGFVNYEVCWLTVKALIYLAHKTDSFAGIDEVKFGPIIKKVYEGQQRNRAGQNAATKLEIEVPQYATATVYRFVKSQRCAFTDTIYFDEAVPLSQGIPNTVWAKKPMLMLAKCAKVASLRLGFAECDYAAEEMEGMADAADLLPSAAMHSTEAHDAPDQHTAPANSNSHAIASSSQFGNSVEDFSSLPKNALTWLNRNLDTAAEIRAFDQTIDAMRETLDLSCHKLGEDLIKSLSVISTDAKFERMWDYIKKARDHGGEAFDQARNQFESQANNGAISHNVSKAAATVLTFMQAAS